MVQYHLDSERVTTDMLIGCVSQVSLNHIGLLVVDEIQNVCNHRNGTNLVSMLTQLINNSGISICMVGTFLSANLSEGKYTSVRGKQRKIALLFYDFKIKFEYCQEGIVKQWQIEKVLAGHRKNPLEICRIAYFLNIPMEELINLKDMGNMGEIFDEK